MDRAQYRRLQAHGAAVRLHDHQRCRHLERPQRGGEGSQIIGDNRQNIGVDDHCAGSLVLPDLGQDFRRQTDWNLFISGLNQLADPLLVGVIGIGVDQRDGDRFDAVLQQFVDRRLDAVFAKRAQDLAAVVDPLRDLDPVGPRHQRLRLLPRQVVQPRHSEAPYLQDVAKALGGDEAGLNPALFQERIGGDRGAVDHFVKIGTGQTVRGKGFAKAFGDTAAVVVRRRCDFDG